MSDALQLILEDTDGTQLETSCTRFAVVWQGKEVWIQAVGDQLATSVFCNEDVVEDPHAFERQRRETWVQLAEAHELVFVIGHGQVDHRLFAGQALLQKAAR